MRIKALLLIITLCLASVNSLTPPAGCEGFASLLNGKREVKSTWRHTDGQNISGTPNVHARFLTKPLSDAEIRNHRKAAFDAIQGALPGSKEIHNTCKIPISTNSQQDMEFIRFMREHHYTVCKVCPSIHDECHELGFCQPDTECYKGLSEDRDHPTEIGLSSSQLDSLHPVAKSFGCCDPKSSHACRTATRTVNSNPKVTYTMQTCGGFACNVEQDNRDKLIARLKNGKLVSDSSPEKYIKDQHTVDGQWSQWAQWSHCPVTCGGGTMSRTRTCTDPAPAGTGHQCVGPSSSTTNCNTNQCPVDGQWSQWGHWSQCSATCGTGDMHRTRSCTNPAPSNGGHNCVGSSSSTTGCNMNQCPVDGQWSQWGQWSHCSVTCGDGTMDRTRTCTNPAPSGGGHGCSGPSSSTTNCNLNQCAVPVDGQWSLWGQWNPCSQSCGGGTMGRARTCNNPAPSGGGHDCVGSSSVTSNCNVNPCPVDGLWSQWGQWSHCSVTCGNGTISRTRTCNNPAPSGGGHNCSGSSSMTSDCSTGHCIVNGQWSQWSLWGHCSVTCDGGTMSRSRTCNYPAPSVGGQNCAGLKSESTACGTQKCPGWFSGACSVTCGNGTVQRLRHCSSGNDADCPGAAFETTNCDAGHCPVNGGWGTWSSFSTCSVTCGDGLHTKTRTCDSPAPKYGGLDCTGANNQTSMCRPMDCPHWLPYEEVSSCSTTCGNGFIQLKRNCSTGVQTDCTGSAYDEKACKLKDCVL